MKTGSCTDLVTESASEGVNHRFLPNSSSGSEDHWLVFGILVLMALEKVWEVFLVLHLQTLVQELDLVLAEIFSLISALVLSHTQYIHHDFEC